MSENKFLSFEEDNEYKENLDKELEKLNKGEITKKEFLEKHINRNTVRRSISLEEYENLPSADSKQRRLDLEEFNKSGINFLGTELGPYRVNDNIPKKREDGTGVGVVIYGEIERLSYLKVRFKMGLIDVIF